MKGIFGLNSSLKSSLSEFLKKRNLNKRKKHLIAWKGNTAKINTTKINTTRINNKTKTNKSIFGPKRGDIIKDLLEVKRQI